MTINPYASPDYRFGFNGMLRVDDVRDEKGTAIFIINNLLKLQ